MDQDNVTEPTETESEIIENREKLTKNGKGRKRKNSSSKSDDEENAKKMKTDEEEEKSKIDKKHQKSNSKPLKRVEMAETSNSGRKFRDKFTDAHGTRVSFMK